MQRLGCPNDCKAKVVSIFGNTGDGKSHTLNHTFFDEENVRLKKLIATYCCTCMHVYYVYIIIIHIILCHTMYTLFCACRCFQHPEVRVHVLLEYGQLTPPNTMLSLLTLKVSSGYQRMSINALDCCSKCLLFQT